MNAIQHWFATKPGTTAFFVVIGLCTGTSWALRVVNFIRLHSFHRSKISRYLQVEGGNQSWALVTGSSDGIGKGLARELARQGFNIVLHGRNKKKLDGVRVEFEQEYTGRQFRVLVADAATSDSMKQAVKEAAVALQNLPGPLRVLVNNVGGAAVMKTPFETLQEHTADEVDQLISLNAEFTVQITRTLMPTLTRNHPSLILNCGSVAGILPGPWIDVYAGTKGFINAWGAALSREMKGEGTDVEVLTAIIAQVNETSSLRESGTFFAPSATTVGRSIVQKVGCGQGTVVVHWTHALQIAAVAMMPDWLVNRVLIDTAKNMRAEFQHKSKGA